MFGIPSNLYELEQKILIFDDFDLKTAFFKVFEVCNSDIKGFPWVIFGILSLTIPITNV